MKNFLRIFKKTKLTEEEKADLVVHKLYMGLETTTEDLQIFVNNSEYIEGELLKLHIMEES